MFGMTDFGDRLFESMRPAVNEAVKDYINRSITCNRLAKRAGGGTRQDLYRLKDQNIMAALLADPAALVVTVDHDLHHGLLSVVLRSDPRVRVHTHENWLNDARRSDGDHRCAKRRTSRKEGRP